MSETALTYVRPVAAELGTKLAAVAGIASAVFFLVGTAVLNVPTKATDSELVQWWSINSHQLDALASMVSFTVAGLLFLVFLAHLRTRLLAAEGGAGTLTTIVFSAGLLFVGTLFVAATARGVISFAVKSPAGDQPLPGVDLLRYLPQVSTYRSAVVRIRGARPLPARADSYDLGTTPVTFRTRPGALRVVAPEPSPPDAAARRADES